jgi:hypothetical protein
MKRAADAALRKRCGRMAMRRPDGEEPNAENYLLYWRRKRNLSLNTLSARIAGSGYSFVSAKTLNRSEKGETPLPDWALADVAKVLKVSEEELLHGPREADPHLPVNLSGAYTDSTWRSPSASSH